MYCEVSHDIQVTVEPTYIEEQSSPESGYYFFAYKVSIKNLGPAPSQLVNRHWIITDGHGHVEEVQGPGVVGEQPTLKPGESYEYISACPLTTPTGNMRGHYQMVDAHGRFFNVAIPLFFLRAPRVFSE